MILKMAVSSFSAQQQSYTKYRSQHYIRAYTVNPHAKKNATLAIN
jgi:hypothetical protein